MDSDRVIIVKYRNGKPDDLPWDDGAIFNHDPELRSEIIEKISSQKYALMMIPGKEIVSIEVLN